MHKYNERERDTENKLVVDRGMGVEDGLNKWRELRGTDYKLYNK